MAEQITLERFRADHPEYDWASDEKLAEGLHKKFYSNIPFEEFQSKIGMQPTPERETFRGMALPTDEQAGYELGPNEAGKKRMEGKTLMQKLGAIDQALGSAVATGATFGTGPALDALARKYLDEESATMLLGKKPMDQRLAEGKELIGGGGEFLGETAGGVLSPAMKLLPSAWPFMQKFLSQTFKPGAKEAAKRVAGAVVDTGTIAGTESALRGESPGPAAAGTVLPAAGLALLTELLTKGKRSGGQAYRQKGMSEEALGREEARPIVEEMLNRAPQPRPSGTVIKQLGSSGGHTAVSLAGRAPQEFENLRQTAMREDREIPGNIRRAAAEVAGRPVPSAGQQQRQYKEEVAARSQEYLPEFEASPGMPNAMIWLDRGGQKRNRERDFVSIPKGYEKILKKPSAYASYTRAREEGQRLADRYSVRDRGGKPPTATEVFWYTIRSLRNGSADEKILADSMTDVFSTQKPELRTIVEAEGISREKGRAAKVGSKGITNPDLIPEYRGAEKVPEAGQALLEGFLASLTKQGNRGRVPPVIEELRTTATKLAGAEGGNKLIQTLEEAARTKDVNLPLTGFTGRAMPEVAAQPADKGKKVIRAISRLVGGAGAFGVPGMVASAGPALGQLLKDNPRLLTDPQVKGILHYFGQPDLGPALQRNAFETRFNDTGRVVVPAVTAYDQAEHRRSRAADKRARETWERSKKQRKGN